MPQVFSELVPQLMKKLGVNPGGYEIITLVERAVQDIAPSARVAAYKNGKMYIEADDSVQLFEMISRKREILKSLQAIAGIEMPELKFYLKGCARPSAADRLRNSQSNKYEKISKKRE